MLGLAGVFFVLALVAGALAFVVGVGLIATAARPLFFLFLILHIAAAIGHLARRRPPL